MDKGSAGSFLVRASTHSPGDYVISVQVDGEVTHVIIKRKNGKFDVGGGPSFSELQELIEHYKKTPLVETNGRVINLRMPFHATSFLPSSIKQRYVELEKQTQEVGGKAAFWEEFEVCIMCLMYFICLSTMNSKFNNKNVDIFIVERRAVVLKTSPKIDTRIYCHVSITVYKYTSRCLHYHWSTL